MRTSLAANPVRIRPWPILCKQAAVLCRVKADEYRRTIGSPNERCPDRRTQKLRPVEDTLHRLVKLKSGWIVAPQLIWRSATRRALVLMSQQNDICRIDAFLRQHRIKQDCHSRAASRFKLWPFNGLTE